MCIVGGKIQCCFSLCPDGGICLALQESFHCIREPIPGSQDQRGPAGQDSARGGCMSIVQARDMNDKDNAANMVLNVSRLQQDA